MKKICGISVDEYEKQHPAIAFSGCDNVDKKKVYTVVFYSSRSEYTTERFYGCNDGCSGCGTRLQDLYPIKENFDLKDPSWYAVIKEEVK